MIIEVDIISAFERNAEEYDRWYHEEPGSLIFESEVKAIEALVLEGYGVEIGVGTGAFSSRLGIPLGLDPALRMVKIAKKKGITVIRAVGEFLPIKSNSFNYILFAFTISFLRDLRVSLKEVYRVLKSQGNIVIGFIVHDSEWGKLYSKNKSEGHIFYKNANFYSVKEIKDALESIGFKITKCFATLSQIPSSVTMIEEPSNNVYHRGFVCIKAIKNLSINHNRKGSPEHKKLEV